MLPRVSVIIPAYNASRYVGGAVESALAQTYRDLDVVVVDDGSRESMEWVTDLDPARVRYFRKENGGPGSARNYGARAAKGELIAFLDADDLWHPQKIARQVETLAEDPEAALVCSRWEQMDSEGRPVPPGPSQPFGASGWVFDRLFMCNFVGTLTVLVRRSAFAEAGGFDESSEIIAAEDYDLWLRIAKRHRLVFLQESLARYRVHEGGIGNDPGVAYARERLVVERAAARHPHLAPHLPERLGRLFLLCGLDYFQRARLTEARAQFVASVRHWPWSRTPWLYLGGTFLSKSQIEAIRGAGGVARQVLRGQGLLGALLAAASYGSTDIG